MSVPGFNAVRLQGLRRARDSRRAWTRSGPGSGPSSRRSGSELLPDVSAHRRRPGLRARGQARAPHRQPARRHLGGLRARQARLQEALPLQGRRLAPRRALPLRGRPRARRQEALGRARGSATRRKLVPVLRRGQGPRVVQERARRGAGRRPRRPARRRRWRASATSSRARATASSCSAAPFRPPRPRAGHPPTTRASPARRSTCWRRCTACARLGGGSAPSDASPNIGLRRRSRRSRSGASTAPASSPTMRAEPLDRFSELSASCARLDERRARSVGYHAWSMTATRSASSTWTACSIDCGAHHRDAWRRCSTSSG